MLGTQLVRSARLRAYGTSGDDELPSEIGFVDVGGCVAKISTGAYNTCVVTEDGKSKCWGENSSFAAGYLTYGEPIGDNERPVDLEFLKVGEKIRVVSAGDLYACGVLESGRQSAGGTALDGRGSRIRCGLARWD